METILEKKDMRQVFIMFLKSKGVYEEAFTHIMKAPNTSWGCHKGFDDLIESKSENDWLDLAFDWAETNNFPKWNALNDEWRTLCNDNYR